MDSGLIQMNQVTIPQNLDLVFGNLYYFVKLQVNNVYMR